MKRVVLFTGQIRDPERGALLLRTIQAYRDSHRPTILLSTWPDEVARWPQLHAELAAAQVRIIVQEEPGPRTRGHLLHQVFAIDAGLAQCDPDAYVLKTRTDLGSVNDVHAFFRSDPPDPVAPGSRSPFAARIATRGFFGAQPFFINDISFAGIARDLRRLGALPAIAAASYSRHNSTEQMIWGPGFAALHPELEAYFRLNPGLVFHNPELQRHVREGLMQCTLYHRVLAIGFAAVADSLRWLLPADGDAAVAEACRTQRLEDLLWSAEPIPGLFQHPGCATNFITHRAVARALVEGDYAPSAFGDRVAAMVRLYRANPPAIDADTLHAEADALFHVSAGQAGLGDTMRHFVRTGSSTRLTGALPDWLSEQGAADSVRHLETELSGLRRANERITAQLRALQG